MCFALLIQGCERSKPIDDAASREAQANKELIAFYKSSLPDYDKEKSEQYFYATEHMSEAITTIQLCKLAADIKNCTTAQNAFDKIQREGQQAKYRQDVEASKQKLLQDLTSK